MFAAESASLCLSMRNGDFMQQHSMAKQHVTLMEANSARSLSCLSIPPSQAFLPPPGLRGAREKTDIIYTRNCTLRTAHAVAAGERSHMTSALRTRAGAWLVGSKADNSTDRLRECGSDRGAKNSIKVLTSYVNGP